jgi:hypothetical protein
LRNRSEDLGQQGSTVISENDVPRVFAVSKIAEKILIQEIIETISFARIPSCIASNNCFAHL